MDPSRQSSLMTRFARVSQAMLDTLPRKPEAVRELVGKSHPADKSDRLLRFSAVGQIASVRARAGLGSARRTAEPSLA
jgi:hypothetical protein